MLKPESIYAARNMLMIMISAAFLSATATTRAITMYTIDLNMKGMENFKANFVLR